MWAGVLAGVLVVAFFAVFGNNNNTAEGFTRTRFRALEVRIRHSLAQGQDVNSPI